MIGLASDLYSDSHPSTSRSHPYLSSQCILCHAATRCCAVLWAQPTAEAISTLLGLIAGRSQVTPQMMVSRNIAAAWVLPTTGTT
jgi:hypothetical protein